jgi:hypothetical protein
MIMRTWILPVFIIMGNHAVAQTDWREKLDSRTTEIWLQEPKKVTPGESSKPPSDATVLFDGNPLNQWMSSKGTEPRWEVQDGVMTIRANTESIKTRQLFGDVQLHIEWRSPMEIRAGGQDRGNSGVYLQERYEIQILDSYENRTYSNGQAGSLYKQGIPMVNASRKPGEWQSYDIVYTAPRFSEKGTLIVPAYITVFHNGILIHNHVALAGSTVNQGLPVYEVHGKGAILLQDHGHAVSYRNIWVREL